MPPNSIGMLLIGVVEGVTLLSFFIRCSEGGTCMISTLTILYGLIEMKWLYPSALCRIVYGLLYRPSGRVIREF